LIDTRICHECSKEISVLYPHLWRYKRKVKFGRIYYFCSWSCLRAYEKKGETKVKLTSEQKQQAIEMAIAGTSPISFIRDCGVNNPENCWWYIKKKLKESDPETAAKIPGFRPSKKEEETVTFEGKEYEQLPAKLGDTISAEDLCPPIKVPAEEPAFEKRYTAMETTAGDFQYFRKTGYLDWTPLDGCGTVSMTLEEWKEFMRVFPLMIADLGVNL